MRQRPHPFVLLILDGWGFRDETDANAIAHANKPFWDHLWQTYPHALISGCGKCVGLPDDQMGNSEVGHLNMGAGRVVHQDLTRIDLDIESEEFYKNPILIKKIQDVVSQKKAIHILGLLSDGGVHSHINHIHALLDLAAKQSANHVYLHAFLDGRDTPPKSADTFLTALMTHCARINCGKIVSLIGRYFAMDRDKRWDRIEKAYALITEGKADYHAKDAISGLHEAYARGETDEFVNATVIGSPDSSPVRMQEGDLAIFMNFRADRARELTQAFVNPTFTGFNRHYLPKLTDFITLTEYDATLKTSVIYAPQKLTQLLGEYLSQLGLTQLRIAETEKYAHVTFFFNGGVEIPFPGEERILIPSPKVATYDLQPEMSALEITDVLVDVIKKQKYDFIICNYANPDMVGHTGNFRATVKAIETIDTCLNKVITALQSVGGEALITADHGNAELMYDATTGQPHTAHTHERVPLIYVGRPATVIKSNGVLADVAPSMLNLLGIKQPTEMTGEPIFHLQA